MTQRKPLLLFMIIILCGIVLPSTGFGETVRVAICQIQVTDGDVLGNLTKVEDFVRQAAEARARICVFPELIDVGFGPIVKAQSGAELARPIPGETTDRLGEIALQYRMWIEAALLEAVPGGAYDTNVLIDERGKVVLKQRKAFVYPVFGGAPAFQGNYHDAQVVDSPWGPIGVMNCADTGTTAKRAIYPAQQPALMLVSFANPQATLLDNLSLLAQECACPVVGVNMVFPDEASGKKGGRSRFIDADGSTRWEAASSLETMKTWDMEIDPPANLGPRVDAGKVQTIRLPDNSVVLHGHATDDGLPGSALMTTWSKARGSGPVEIEDPDALSTAVWFSDPGVYLFRLAANDGEFVRTDAVTINVLPSGQGDLELAGYWTFDNTPNDSSGMGNHGTPVGVGRRTIYSTDAAPTGFANSHSLNLDGSQVFVRVDHHASLNAEDAVTIAMWIKARSYPGFWPTGNDWSQLLNKGNVWGGQNYMVGFGAYFYLHADGMGMRIPCLDDTVRTPGQWHHVAVVLDADQRQGRMYFNGVLDHTVFNVPDVRINSDPLYIGRGDPGNPTKINGQIDDVRLYTRALSDAEIATLVPGAVVNEAPLIDAGPDTMSSTIDVSLHGVFSDEGGPSTGVTARWTVWRKVSGPGEVTFDELYELITTASFERPGAYVLELQGSDGGHLVRDTTVITIQDSVQD
jgi:predicted amidohydrolase